MQPNLMLLRLEDEYYQQLLEKKLIKNANNNFFGRFQQGFSFETRRAPRMRKCQHQGARDFDFGGKSQPWFLHKTVWEEELQELLLATWPHSTPIYYHSLSRLVSEPGPNPRWETLPHAHGPKKKN
jgi:hypothetical protein